MSATFATATHTGLVRRGNEDACFARPPVFAVADGMGGALAGEVASRMAVEALERFAPGGDGMASGLASLVEEVNADILARAQSDTRRAGMGTTLTAAVLTDGAVDLVHVGDSRAYLWRQGELRQLTDDHSLVGEMIRRGELSPAAARSHPQRSIITRALGAEEKVELDRESVATEPGDLLLLCSDGLYAMVPDAAIAAILAAGDDLAQTAGALIEAANAGGGADNITVVLVSPDGSRPAGGQGGPPPAVTAGSGEPGGTAAPDTGGHGEEGAAAQVPDSASGRRPLWKSGRLWLAAALLLLAATVAATWYMTRQVYYLDFSGDRLAIYQGVPVELGPVSLSGLYRESGVTRDELMPYELERISRHELKSLQEAEMMLDNYIEQYGQDEPERPPAGGRDGAGARTTTVGVTV